MKPIKSLLLLLLVGTISISCERNEDVANASGNEITGSMKGTLNGNSWEAKKVSFGGISALIQANGIIDDNNTISLELRDTDLELNKTYQFDAQNLEQNLLGTLIVRLDGTPLLAKSGTFIIRRYVRNTVIEGEINAELTTNFVDTQATLQSCKFVMEYK